jgi:hypothetical protein
MLALAVGQAGWLWAASAKSELETAQWDLWQRLPADRLWQVAGQAGVRLQAAAEAVSSQSVEARVDESVVLPPQEAPAVASAQSVWELAVQQARAWCWQGPGLAEAGAGQAAGPRHSMRQALAWRSLDWGGASGVCVADPAP